MPEVEIVRRDEPQLPVDLIQYSQNLQITTNDQFVVATSNLQLCRLTKKNIEAYWNPLIKEASITVTHLREKRNTMLEKIESIENPIESQLHKYNEELQKQKSIEEAKSIDKYHKEQEKVKLKAEELCKQGKSEQAAELLANVKVPEAKIPEQPDKQGISLQKIYDFEITNPEEFVKKYPEYSKPDEVKIRKVVNAHRGKIQLDYIRIFSKEVTRCKARDMSVKDAF